MEKVVRGRFQENERVQFLSTTLTIPVNARISKTSAVAFIIREFQNELCVLLTKRASSLDKFANDICLPGGMYDALDNTVVNTALREAQEEVGIDPEDLSYICTLPSFCAGMGAGWTEPIAVIPVVFWLTRNTELHVNTSEVDAAFWTPLSFFLSSKHHQVETYILVSGANVTMTLFTYHDPNGQNNYVIYGCTGNICVTASSIALNTSPEFPFTGLALYWASDNELVFAEVSTTPLTSLAQTKNYKFVPYINSKL